MKVTFLIIILVATLFEVAADILFKKWSLDGREWLLWVGIGLYTIGTIGWAYSLKFEQLSKAIVVFTLLNLVLVTLAGVIIFNENLSPINKIGILLGIASIILLEI